MLCPDCNKTVRDGDKFCEYCGSSLQVSQVSNSATSWATSSPLTSLNHLVMLWDKLAFHLNYQFQDSSGMPLGETKGEMRFPLKYTLFDTNQQPVLTVDGARDRGISFVYLIHDAEGKVLASLKQKNSFVSRKYSVTRDGSEVMLLTTDSGGYNYKLEDISSGAVLVTGNRNMALKTSEVDIDISETQQVDHRIALGAMILASYASTAHSF